MKKTILMLAVLVLAVPALAGNVTITAVDEGSNVVRIGYVADANVSAFGLDVTVDAGVISAISDYNIGECTASVKGFGIFMGTIVIDELGIVTDDGTPVAPNDAPGALGGLGTSGITLEMGALYEDGNNPALTGTLCRVTVSENCNLTVAGNATRGNVVMEDTTQANLTGVTIPVGAAPECFPSGHPDYDEWKNVVGAPDCWCYTRQCHGDDDNYAEGKSGYWVSINDLTVLKDAWNKDFPTIEGQTSTVETGTGVFVDVEWICADFDHLPEGKFDYRVGIEDLTILKKYWQNKIVVDPNCLDF
jgi:hypothetical protein